MMPKRIQANASVLPFSKTRSRPIKHRMRREKWPAHLAFVASLPCSVLGCNAPANVHHLRVPGTDAAAGRRASDRFAVPCCWQHHQGQGGIHHRGLHDRGSEEDWWAARGIDPLAIAESLWKRSVEEGRTPCDVE